MVMMLGVSPDGFYVQTGPGKKQPPPPPEFVALTELHTERLRALLDKPVLLTVDWNDGDDVATVTVIPTESEDPNAPFERFTLPFP